MTTSPSFSGHIPQALFDAVEAHLAITGEAKTELLIRALAAYIGYELPEAPGAIGADPDWEKELKIYSIPLKPKR